MIMLKYHKDTSDDQIKSEDFILNLINCFLYYDSPIFSLVQRTETKEYFFLLTVDECTAGPDFKHPDVDVFIPNLKFYELAFKVSILDIQNFLDGVTTSRKLLLDSSYVVMFEYDNKTNSIEMRKVIDPTTLTEILPTENSYFDSNSFDLTGFTTCTDPQLSEAVLPRIIAINNESFSAPSSETLH
jgi:hypothetical protein